MPTTKQSPCEQYSEVDVITYSSPVAVEVDAHANTHGFLVCSLSADRPRPEPVFRAARTIYIGDFISTIYIVLFISTIYIGYFRAGARLSFGARLST